MAYKHFYKMYIYIYISDIFVAVYALNARGSGRNIWGLYAAVNSPNPGSVFQRSPIPDVEKVCRSLSLLVSVISLFMLRSPLFQQETSKSSSDHTQICFSFFLCFHLNSFMSGIWLFLTSKCNWILTHASLNDFSPFCLLAAIPTLMSCLFFFFPRAAMM